MESLTPESTNSLREFIEPLRKNRNSKYYELLVSYFDIINDDHDHHVKLSVDEIIRGVNISRPTFYTYYSGAEDFYIDLMEIIHNVWPQYMRKRSMHLKDQDLLKLAFSLKLGVMLSNLKKVGGKFPRVLEPWNQIFDIAVKEMGGWYASRLQVSADEGQKISRGVLNELILHDDIYYQDFEKYKALMLKQITA